MTGWYCTCSCPIDTLDDWALHQHSAPPSTPAEPLRYSTWTGHGTYIRFVDGCRCDPCLAAWLRRRERVTP